MNLFQKGNCQGPIKTPKPLKLCLIYADNDMINVASEMFCGIFFLQIGKGIIILFSDFRDSLSICKISIKKDINAPFYTD